MSDPNTETATEAATTEAATIPPDGAAATPSPAKSAKETLDQAIERIMSAPLLWPAFDRHEAVFRGKAKVRMLRAKLSRSDAGKDMIWLEGVVTSTCKLPLVPGQSYPANNPNGWDITNAYDENDAHKYAVPITDQDGQPVLDEKGQPRVFLRRPEFGPIDVTGFRFVYGGELTKNEDGTFFWKTEQLINNITFLGWRPGRVKVPLTGKSLSDFAPAEGEDYVSAEALGMSGEFIAHFELEEVKEDSRFAPRIMLVNFKLIDVRVTKTEAVSLDDKFGALLSATRDGTRYDGRKVAERAEKLEKAGGKRSGAAVTGKGSATAVAADAARVVGTPPELCGKPCGPDQMACKEKPGHAGQCVPMPF